MAASTPRYLFRCWSDQSNGTNTPTLITPASITDSTNVLFDHKKDFISLNDTANIDFANQLRQALLWKKTTGQPANPFVFFTTSPIFVVQLAIWRSKRKAFKDGTAQEAETGVHIAIIDTQTARTTDGQPVRFQPVSVLLQTHDIQLRNRSDGSLRTYSEDWLVTSSVVPGAGSRVASFQDLITTGFFELYPQIEAANDRQDPRPSLTTDDLRKFFFCGAGKNGSCGGERTAELDTAARVAMCFRGCTEATPSGDGQEMGVLMAFVLSLRKCEVEEPAFVTWLQDHADGTPTPCTETTASDIPDAAEFTALSDHFSRLDFQLETLSFGLSIERSAVENAKEEWLRWWRSNRAEHRAAHPREQRQGRKTHRRHDSNRTNNQQASRPPARGQQLLARRARHDSVVAAPVTQPYPQYRRSAAPRELFPGWAPRRQHEIFDRGPYVAERVRRDDRHGYQVLSSRSGDAVVTRQGHRHHRARETRDRDGAFVRRQAYYRDGGGRAMVGLGVDERPSGLRVSSLYAVLHSTA